MSGCVGWGELDRHFGKRNLVLDDDDDKGDDDDADYGNGNGQ